MRTSTTVMIGFAVVFGLLAVFLANAWLNNRAAEQMRNLEAQRKTAPPTNTIIVAARALKFGDVLTAFSLRELPWPQNALPKGAFGRISELTAARHVVLMPIAANEPILASNITGPGGRATLSAVLQDGMKAATIRVDDVAGIAGFVLPGDRVDVMLTRPDKKINDVLVEDARVLAVDQTADQTKDKPQLVKAVTLEVSETDGQKLALSSRTRHAFLAVAQGRGRACRARPARDAVRSALGRFEPGHDRGHATDQDFDGTGRIQRSVRGERIADGRAFRRSGGAELNGGASLRIRGVGQQTTAGRPA